MRLKQSAACGTPLAYRRGCRCQDCRDANARYERERKDGLHGPRVFRVDCLEGFRWCTKCEQPKPVSEFARNSSREDGLAIWCRRCTSGYHTAYYAEDPEPVKHRTDGARRKRIANGSTRERDYQAKYREEHRGDLRYEMTRRLTSITKDPGRSARGVTINVDDLVALYLAQGGFCALSGRSLKLKSDGPKDPEALSIDRRDNSRGYHADNIRLVIWSVNLALSGWGTTHFLELCRDIVAHQGSDHAAVG